MYNKQIEELNKKVSELKWVVERKIILDWDGWVNEEEMKEIMEYDLKEAFEKNIRILHMLRAAYIILIIATVGVFVYNIYNPRIVEKEIIVDKEVPVKNVENTDVVAEDFVANEPQFPVELSATWTEKVVEELPKVEEILEEEVIVAEASNTWIETPIIEPVVEEKIESVIEEKVEPEIEEKTLSEEEKIEIENTYFNPKEKKKCAWNFRIQINIHVRQFPWKTSESLWVLSPWESVDLINCWKTLEWELWYKVKAKDWISWWMSWIGIKR